MEKHIKFKINGMHCESCIKLSQMNLEDLPGVKEVKIQDLNGETEIVADRDIPMGEIEAAVKEGGYTVTSL